jgi:MYXO-CTERM domain-containing protein
LVEDQSVQRIAYDLVIENDTARCQLNGATQKRPVTVDTVFEALRAERSSCVDVLASDDSGWNQSQCSESESESEGGCTLASTDSSSSSAWGLTSAALFAALVAYRRRRSGSAAGR